MKSVLYATLFYRSSTVTTHTHSIYHIVAWREFKGLNFQVIKGDFGVEWIIDCGGRLGAEIESECFVLLLSSVGL